MEITMKKRLFAVLLSVTMIVSSCGTKSTVSDSKTSTSETQISTEETGTSSDTMPEESNLSAETSSEVSSASTETSEEEIVPAEEIISLKDIYAEHGLKTGTCLTTQMTSNATHTKNITRNFNSITMENAMKPDSILDKKASQSSGEIVVAFNKDVLKMLEWARKNDMAVRGHTLIWYSQTPKWIFHEDFDITKSMVNRETMLQRMESLISQVFAQIEELGYTDLFYAYDVVNEAWLENGQMRQEQNYWYQTIGEDYLWYAFYYADKYAPESIDLYYNDYNEQYKAVTLSNFVETLVDENGKYLIDGIGLQCHLYTADDVTTYLNAVKRLGETGLKLEITELDVGLGAYQNEQKPTEENLAKQGRYYYTLLNGIFEMIDDGSVNMDSITFWGYADNLSWRRSASPMLYDITLKPKYAFYGAAQIKEKAGFND